MEASRQQVLTQDWRLEAPAAGAGGPVPAWLILATIGLTLLILVMAVAETTLWLHFFIDEGEVLALGGLAFILVAGLVLHRRRRLLVSLPLAIPWLLYPVMTQGDQIIDNLTINQMRIVCHAILAALFAAPIAVGLVAARQLLAAGAQRPARQRYWTALVPGLRFIEQGRTTEGTTLFVLGLLLAEILIASQFLGRLMLFTLVGLGVAFLYSVSLPRAHRRRAHLRPWRHRAALVLLLIGVACSLALYLGFKNRAGAYQGSPHYYHDPGQGDGAYPLDEIVAPGGAVQAPDPSAAAEIRLAFEDYAQAVRALAHAYYVLDRNYNYAFHNALFLRHTPVLPGFRERALAEVTGARRLAEAADRRLHGLVPALPADGNVHALLREIQSYVAYSFRRAALLQELTERFEKTEAGLQHATHVYEGEGKMLGVWLVQILEKHRRTLEVREIDDLAGGFVQAVREVHGAYANRIVGF